MSRNEDIALRDGLPLVPRRLHSRYRRMFQELAEAGLDPVYPAMAYTEPDPSDRQRGFLPGATRLPVMPDKEVWRPADALAEKDRSIRLCGSAYGRLATEAEILMRAEGTRGLEPAFRTIMAQAADMTDARLAFWSHEDLSLVLADDPFVDMMEAAALSAPDEPIHPDELISEKGVVFFERRRSLSSYGHPLRGIGWSTVEIGGRPGASVMLFEEGRQALARAEALDAELVPDPEHDQLRPPRDVHSAVRPVVTIQHPFGEPSPSHAYGELLALIRSVSAIARSPRTSDATRTVQRRVKKHGRVQEIREDAVRVLSLRSPEHGRYELDAATGRKVRQHWVRGHWRRQWYASSEEHRTIWIDGFVKGDPAKGAVPAGDRVYAARG